MVFFWLAVALAVGTLLLVNSSLSKIRVRQTRTSYDYDAIIVGGSIAGPFVAKALAEQGRKVLLVERTLFKRPDRIIGELLQPGGLDALKEVGMDACATSVGQPCNGYVVVDDRGNMLDLPYRRAVRGVSLHFGDLVQNLRAHVFEHCSEHVTMVEGTVTRILTDYSSFLERAYGVEYTMLAEYAVPPNAFRADPAKAPANAPVVTRTATAPLVIMCDGGMSKWKARYQHYTPASDYHSNFIGVVLHHVRLPREQRGTVFFGKTGPVLSYRLDPDELRVLVDYNKPTLPSLQEQSRWLVRDVAPMLPAALRDEFVRVTSDTRNLRSMPVARYPPTFPCIRGYVGIGDHNNQRHPLTGGGMTCAFRDALRLANNLRDVGPMRSYDPVVMARIEDRIHDAVLRYSRYRYMHSCCINLLSWALYDVFGDAALRSACVDYFGRGGECVYGPMDLLAGLDPNVSTLAWHYCRVMLYGVLRVMLKDGTTHRSSSGSSNDNSADDTATTTMAKLRNAVTFFGDVARLKLAAHIVIKASVTAVLLARNEFFSAWRFIDPTSAVALIAKQVKMYVYNKMLRGKERKPVGL